MQINTYLSFNGNCEAAFKFYEQALGGKIGFKVTYAGSPMAEKTPPELLGKIMHMRLMVGDNVVMGSDAPCDRYEAAKGFHVSISVEEPEEAERVFKALSENAMIGMPIQETFWAKRFGMLVDQFGTPWMINCEKTA